MLPILFIVFVNHAQLYLPNEFFNLRKNLILIPQCYYL